MSGQINGFTLLIGDALGQLKTLPDNFVDCFVTSPPYYGLRDYGVDGQIGLEETVAEYIDRLVAVFREARRALKTDGTLWLNIGDSYAGSGKGAANYPDNAKKYKQGTNRGMLGQGKTVIKNTEFKRKDLMGIPWRLAFALQEDGWYLRQDIVWYKPNCMPESVKDRCTKSHEYIFLMSKSDKYYFDNEAIKESAITADRTSPRGSKGTLKQNAGQRKQDALHLRRYEGFNDRYFSSERKLTRNKRDVWSVPTRGYKEAHFATFPEQLIEPCVLAGCREGGTVCDPFIGSGTTAVVAVKHGRRCIGIDINPNYGEITLRRMDELMKGMTA